MFCGCFCHTGTGSLSPVDGMMTSAKYQEVLSRKLIPELSKRFPDGSGVFQQDLAPCHTSKQMQKFFKESKITVLEWPGNSPDINPIDNLWSIRKARLRNHDCTTKEKLINSVTAVWYHDPEIQRMCENLSNSMPSRVAAVIASKGGHIKY